MQSLETKSSRPRPKSFETETRPETFETERETETETETPYNGSRDTSWDRDQVSRLYHWFGLNHQVGLLLVDDVASIASLSCFVTISLIGNIAFSQWCSQERNLRDRDLAQTSRPRPRFCHKSRDRDLEVRDRDSRPHISLVVIKANSMKNAAKNIWNVAKYQDKGVCHCYASINLFWIRRIINCLIRYKTLLTILCKDRTWCPTEAPMFWPQGRTEEGGVGVKTWAWYFTTTLL